MLTLFAAENTEMRIFFATFVLKNTLQKLGFISVTLENNVTVYKCCLLHLPVLI